MAEDASGEIRIWLRSDLKLAMQARRGTEVSVLRTLLAAIDNARAPAVVTDGRYRSLDFQTGAAEAPRRELTLSEVRTILRQEAVQRRESAAQLAIRGRAADAAQLEEEAAIVLRYVDGDPERTQAPVA